MAYKTNVVIKAELEALSVAYDDDMDNKELRDLLDEATDAPDEQPETETQEASAQAPEVNLGVGVINDHEKRIFAIEQKLKMNA